jgi:hypothetical protein
MRTKEQIKEQIIELNFDLLRFFDNKVKVKEIRQQVVELIDEYLSL